MKRFYFAAMAMILATMASCQKEEEYLDLQSNTEHTFYATFENSANTRTALDASNNVVWSEDDQISVFSGTTANNSFILREGANTTFGTFKVNSVVAGTESDGSTSDLSANVAYYPYDSNVTVSASNSSYILNATFPATQTYSESGTFGNGASPMVAVTSSTLDANLKFKNVGAIFRLQLKGNGAENATITKVVFSAEANLAGDVAITASNTSLPTVNVTEGSNIIILDCGEGVELTEEPTNFVVAMLPVEDLGNLTITMYDNTGKKMVSTWNKYSSIERSKAYTTDEIVYSGDEETNTQVSVQAALDNATTGTTIQLEPGVDYGVLEIRAVKDNANTTSDNNLSDYRNNLLRKVENLTIKGAPGAKVDAIKVTTGYMGQIIDGKTTCYFADIKNLVIDGVEFTDKHTSDSHSIAAPIFISLTHANVDGLTVKNCKLQGDNNKMNFVYFYGKQQYNFTTAAKNITITGNTVDGIARLCELRGAENVTITNNIISNTYQHAILLAKDGINYSGNVTITDNEADGIGERFVRMAGAGDATVVIRDNVITNYKGADYDYIKVTDANNTPVIENNTCSYTVSDATEAQAALDAAISGTIIQLEPSVNYGVLEIRAIKDNANTTSDNDFSVYKYDLLRNVENLTIKGAPGAKVDAIKVTTGYMGQIIDGKTTCYFADIKNLVIDGVEFTDKHTSDSHSFAAPIFISLTHANVDGLTVKNCNLQGNNDKLNFVYFYGKQQYDFATAAKNITITGNTVDGIARLCELRGAENVTITNNIISNTYLHAILLAKDGVNYSGNVTITDNEADGIGERFVRMAGAGDATVVIRDNVITNYKGADSDYIKVTDFTSGSLTNENNTCTY